MGTSLQQGLLLPEVGPCEALDFLAVELKYHRDSGRKNFLIRVPEGRIQYLFGLVLRASKISKVELEAQLANMGICGFAGQSDGRIVRRYFSGEAKMTWLTYQRILIWALCEGWIKDYIFEFLLFESFNREAAQLALRGISKKYRRQVTAISITIADLAMAFNSACRAKELERHATTVRKAETNSQFKELAIKFGVEFD